MNKTFTINIKLLILTLRSLLIKAFNKNALSNKELVFVPCGIHPPNIKGHPTLFSVYEDSNTSWFLKFSSHRHLTFWFNEKYNEKRKVSLEEISGEGSETIGNERIPSGSVILTNPFSKISNGFFKSTGGKTKWEAVIGLGKTLCLMPNANSFGYTGMNIRMYVTKTLLL